MIQGMKVFIISLILHGLKISATTVTTIKVVLKCNTSFSKQTCKDSDFPSGLIGPPVPPLWSPICLPVLIFAKTHSEYDVSIDFMCCDSMYLCFIWGHGWDLKTVYSFRYEEIRVRLAASEKNDEGWECTP